MPLVAPFARTAGTCESDLFETRPKEASGEYHNPSGASRESKEAFAFPDSNWCQIVVTALISLDHPRALEL